jgi:hypothetical protein
MAPRKASRALVQPRGEEQEVGPLKQLVDDPRGVCVDRRNPEAVAPKERVEGAPYHRVCAEDGYGREVMEWHDGRLLAREDSSSGVLLRIAERAGALRPDPLLVVVCFTSLGYFILKKALIVEPSLAVTATL